MGDWQPRFTLTPAAVRHLMEIEGARAIVEQVADLPPWLEYFLEALGAAFAAAKDEALRASQERLQPVLC